jgi:GNAT superfamily N-acetyltransferase
VLDAEETRALRDRYDREVRAGRQAEDPAYVAEWDGPVYRLTGPGPEPGDNCVLLSRLDAGDADAAIARQVAHYGARGHAFEWKLYDHDLPADLPARLAAAGFAPEEPETLVVRDLEAPARPHVAPAGVHLRRLDDPADLGLIVDLNVAVYGDLAHARYLATSLAEEKRACPRALVVYVALAGEQVVSAGWLRCPTGSAFASLWGGATLEAWRGRGVYTALVERRAADARGLGARWLAVDCSPHSLPILVRRGFTPLAVTTPWIWRP